MLVFGLDPAAWRLYCIRNLDPAFIKFRDKIFSRDSYSCKYCGFQAFEGMCVINKDYNYKNNIGNNLITACPFCAQCHFLYIAGADKVFSGGTIIYAPEIAQQEINAICHVLFCSIFNASDQSEFSQTLYNNLRLRSQIIEEKLGKGMSDPRFFAQMLIDTPLKQKNSVVKEIFLYTRLLPSKNNFATQVLSWSKSSLDEF